jgi:hypothetical protein
MPVRQSEHELQPQLQLAHRFTGARDLTVVRVGQHRGRIVPDRMVDGVERFEPELQRLRRADAEVPDDR